MIYKITFSHQFEKDVKLAQKQGKNMTKMLTVIEKLANGEQLEAKYRDHALIGNYAEYRECHIEPDWLMIYRKHEDVLVLLLQRIGSHSDLFKK